MGKSRRIRWATAIAVALLTAALGAHAQATGTTRTAHAAAAASPAAATSTRDECGRAGLEITTGLAGGYRCAPTPYGDEVIAAAQALVTAADETLPAAARRQNFVVRSAATQVVAGVNYKLVVRVRCPRPETLIGTVFVSLQGSPAVTNLYALAG
jgi:hypothetical protein